MWMSLFISFLLYIPLFFWGRGNVTIGENPWHFEFHSRQRIDDPHGLRRYALLMIAYVSQDFPMAVHANDIAPC
jgi:hypothetical protein